MTPARAARLRRHDEQKRREKRQSRLILIGVILLSTASMVAYSVFYAIPRLTNPDRYRHTHRPTASEPVGTNRPATRPPPEPK